MALYISAGGPGDLIAGSALASSKRDTQPIFAAMAWERPSLDAHIGPRGSLDFHAVGPTGLVSPGARPRNPMSRKVRSFSGLPALSALLPGPLHLIEPGSPAEMAKQIDRLSRQCRRGPAFLIDVGGDVLASEPSQTLESPVHEALMLSALRYLEPEPVVVIAGAGYDGELSRKAVLSQAFRGAKSTGIFAAAVMTELHRKASHLPYETSLLLTLSRKFDGHRVCIGPQKILSPSAEDALWFEIPLDKVLTVNGPWRIVVSAGTASEASSVLGHRGYPDEIAYARNWHRQEPLNLNPREAFQESDFIGLRPLCRLYGLDQSQKARAFLIRKLSTSEAAPFVALPSTDALPQFEALLEACREEVIA